MFKCINIDALKDRIFQVICLFESQEIQVEALSCDLGNLNKVVLKRLNIYGTKSIGATNQLNIPDYEIVNSFQNSFRFDEEIQVFLNFTQIFNRWIGQFERSDLIIDESVRAR